MKRGCLQVIAVPWMVSSSVPEMRVSVTENGHTHVELDVAVLPERFDDALVHRGVEIHFEHGQWTRTHPAVSDTDPVPRDLFDWGGTEPRGGTQDIDDWVRDFRAQWRQIARCPDPRFYEVLGSLWLAEEGAQRFGCRHFILVGHDMWVEVLSVSVKWRWTNAAATWIDPSSLARRSP